MLAIALMAAGCTPAADAPAGGGATTSGAAAGGSSSTATGSGTIDLVDICKGPLTTTILYVIKDDKPHVLMDMLPEAPTLRGLTDAAAREYLMKRALAVLVGEGLGQEKFAGRTEFTVRMILLNDVDEYGKPRWGQAPQIALFSISRSKLERLDKKGVDALKRDQLPSLFDSANINLAPLHEAKPK
ncbi:MAG: hypothetical protein K8T25_22505 [Planctomycetia bacterium]|nr:hypothetical protein [Planctomycetia bacterium]